MSRSPLIPRSNRPTLITSRQDRAVAKRVSEIHGEAVELRARDMARRELVKGRISDQTDVGRHVFNEWLGLEHDYKAAVDAAPFESGFLHGIMEDVAVGIRYEVRSYQRGD